MAGHSRQTALETSLAPMYYRFADMSALQARHYVITELSEHLMRPARKRWCYLIQRWS